MENIQLLLTERPCIISAKAWCKPQQTHVDSEGASPITGHRDVLSLWAYRCPNCKCARDHFYRDLSWRFMFKKPRRLQPSFMLTILSFTTAFVAGRSCVYTNWLTWVLMIIILCLMAEYGADKTLKLLQISTRCSRKPSQRPDYSILE